MNDVVGRLANRMQLTTDGHKLYLAAVEDAFGADIDYAVLQKIYGVAGGVGLERKHTSANTKAAVPRLARTRRTISLAEAVAPPPPFSSCQRARAAALFRGASREMRDRCRSPVVQVAL